MHNYLKKLLESPLTKNRAAGEVYHVSIQHDEWCAIFKDGACNCDPDIKPWPRMDQ